MNKFKAYIQALFNESGSQAMPYFQKTGQVDTVQDCNNLNYTIIYDGYVQIRFSCASNTNWYCRVYADNRPVFGAISPIGAENQYVDFFFAVVKGTTITAFSNLTNVTARLSHVPLAGRV